MAEKITCPKCKGSGMLTNDGKPWQEADHVARRLGEVTPEVCDQCKKTGEVNKPS